MNDQTKWLSRIERALEELRMANGIPHTQVRNTDQRAADKGAGEKISSSRTER